MGLLSILRAKWRGHDDKLAEHAYRDRDRDAALDEREHLMDSMPSTPHDRSDLSVMPSGVRSERAIEDTVRSEDALEHEEPR
jgi:hypothetical protein